MGHGKAGHASPESRLQRSGNSSGLALGIAGDHPDAPCRKIEDKLKQKRLFARVFVGLAAI